jgi:glycerate kinase
MPLDVLIVPDKFKGTLTAQQAAEAIARGWRSARSADTLELLPMSDGGDGFGEVISQLIGAEARTVKTVDAAHRPLEAQWWWHPASHTAVVESAAVIGLAQLPPGKYHPFELDTFGVGAVFQAAQSAGARRCLVGIGGSATNDAGFGVARALGWHFSNAHEEEISRWTGLHRLSTIRPPAETRLFDELVVAVDVQNPLLGPAGCTRVYGPQKGLTEFDFAERCLEQLSSLLKKELHLEFANLPGAGAAGGLGYGLCCFAGARLEPGFNLFARFAKLEERLKSAQLVITGEGALDAQTLMGKGVGQIAGLCQRLNIPCFGLAGVVSDPQQAKQKFTSAYALTSEFTTKESALSEPALWLERLAAKAASDWRYS